MSNEDDFRRQETRRGLVAEFEQTLDNRVNRYLEVQHAGIVANHHFAAASSECIDLYRDGHFLSAVMVSQAVTEGIWRFVLERNNEPTNGRQLNVLIALLVERKTLTQDCADALARIWDSFRNDVHHMKPEVAAVPFVELAKRNLFDLGVIERELFAWTVTEPGKITPTQPKYWDLQPDGTAPVFLRNPWV
jgi:hypothetical protein